MQVFLTRDSVAAGDDADAPHARTTTVPDGTSIEAIVAIIAKSGYLASIRGGKATWVVTSKIPLAVVAQEWEKPKMLLDKPRLDDVVRFNKLDTVDNGLRLHFRYFVQRDPQIVYEELQREPK